MLRTLSVFHLLPVLVVCGLAPAYAQSDNQADGQTPPSENWGSGCTASERSAPLDCSVFQRVIDSKTGRLITMVRIRVPGDTKSPVMLVQMPLGIYLPGQIELSVDGAAMTTIGFQTCDQNGCYAGMEVAANLLNAMLKGQTLDLKIQNQARQPSSVPISLTGFAKAYGQIR